MFVNILLYFVLSVSHSRSRGQVTAPIRSRKSQRRCGSVTNRCLWWTPRNRILGGCGTLLGWWGRM